MKKNRLIYGLIAILFTSCIQDIEKLTEYPYKIGDVYSENGTVGIVYKVSDDGAHGMIVSLNEFEGAWGDTIVVNTKDSVNGVKNMEVIRKKADWQKKYPAFYWCDNKNKDGITGWYMPAKNELEEILKQRGKINEVLATIGAISMFGKNYWSSTEYGKYEAYHADFIGGDMKYYAMKINPKKVYVRAVKRF
ncbi:MAG TPA: DUF1566 domain-containing protein [Bacteroidales bacterium]|nr:DUF1566 domain-containing protein [Bacteroidales bacterium]HON20491.1 DUF1566 domain-containing protein [Bacteroidales bacterium]HOR81828.1 DUF1566 domain-containing protein [Bacteroidales bacterium]HPJ90939.1 DUF1566 domain-containing protein [Bacteroidales bacterium]HQB19640.1 DUF1566 domain-containing protein [Bacteroidales bacterium]